jgi:hypothetical protein
MPDNAAGLSVGSATVTEAQVAEVGRVWGDMASGLTVVVLCAKLTLWFTSKSCCLSGVAPLVTSGGVTRHRAYELTTEHATM